MRGWKRLAGLLTIALVMLAVTPRALAAAPVSSPTSTVTPTPASLTCNSEGSCIHAVLTLLNRERIQHRLAPYGLLAAQSTGRAACAGSYGHSLAMARSGTIWHSNNAYPRASFPHDICVQYRMVGENVGESASGNELQDLTMIHDAMMSEPHSPHTCRTTISHACNILDASFRHVGIGIYHVQGTTWLTEDFTG